MYGQEANRPDFDPSNFNPYVTLGFTSRDLFESDGSRRTSRVAPARTTSLSYRDFEQKSACFHLMRASVDDELKDTLRTAMDSGHMFEVRGVRSVSFDHEEVVVDTVLAFRHNKQALL